MAMARSRIASVEYAERLKQLEAEAAEARRAERAARRRQAEQAAQQYFADRAAEADRRTRALADRVAELRTVLERGLRRSPRIDLAGMRAEFSQPAPDLGSVGWRAIPPGLVPIRAAAARRWSAGWQVTLATASSWPARGPRTRRRRPSTSGPRPSGSFGSTRRAAGT